MNRKNIITVILSLTIISVLIFSCTGFRGSKDYLREGFLNPPDSARPGVYWYFMDGNIDRRAITADLESMKSAGIGYVLFLEVNVGVPRGNTDFLSEEWQDLFTHAVRECERLGIRLILGSGPGWAGSGGPWVKPEESMMHLVAYDTVVAGPAMLECKLPVPKPRKPFFGENTLTDELKKIRDSWYEDVKVLAFPSPEKPVLIKDIDEKALYYRAPYTSQPGVVPFIPVKEKYPLIPGSAVDRARIRDITSNMKPDGTIQWIVPPGKWNIIRFGKRNNGAVTRPAPLPGLGFEADKFDTAAFRSHYEAYIGKLIRKVKPVKAKSGGGWTMIHIDSWEMGAQNWSKRFIEEFIIRRGYDPMLYLPVYCGYIVNSEDESERFLWDLRQTSNELIIENHAGFFKQLGRKNGFRLSIEPYDMNPAADLSLGEVADIPMCEFWTDGLGFNSSFSCMEAVSIGHVTGRNILAAEAFTANRHEAWKMYPGNMKNQTDWAFAMGINRIIFHTFAHKPLGDQYLPGMTMGPYGVHWDRGQTWWPMVNAYHKYIARCQFILSQGKPVADILFLTPEGAPHVFRPPASALEGTDFLPDKRSYSFDACTPGYLISSSSVYLSRINFPGGASYRVLVLPDVPSMTPELAAKLDRLMKEGAVIVGQPPVKSPSLTNYPRCDSIVRQFTIPMWRTNIPDDNSTKINYGLGTMYRSPSLRADRNSSEFELYPSYERIVEEVLKNMGVKEDFISEGNIRYIHRAAAGRDIYFLSNRTNRHIADSCYFRDGTLSAEIWDPVTADIRALKGLATNSKGVGAVIKLEPRESCFVIFYHPESERYRTSKASQDNKQKTIAAEIKGPWEITFETEWGGPGKMTSDTLFDWSERTEMGIKYYSGIVNYKTVFTLPDSIDLRKDPAISIDPGTVNVMARIRLNGEDLGTVWTNPAGLKTGKALRKGKNTLEIEVSNLWINRLIGDEYEPWDGAANGQWPEWLMKGEKRPTGRYTFTTHRYYKKDDLPVPSGLTGPVRLYIFR